jgi:hypothetical protein
MENSIGVGLIVGLAFASSIYVWNNEKFSSVQKTILLICIIFPPAQWLGIFVVLAYNSSVESNMPERKTEKKLDTTISNLTELKEKGILTAEEYKTKVQKIETEKTEQSLKSSLEYKQLKSLFDNKILTLEEFENKIKLLKTYEIFNSIHKRNELENFDSLQKVYRETTDNKTLKIISQYNQTIGAEVFINNLPAPDGIYNYKSGTHKLILENGKIKERYFIRKYKNFFIEQKSENIVSIGDKVNSIDKNQIEDGKYNLGFALGKIIVENGIVLKL